MSDNTDDDQPQTDASNPTPDTIVDLANGDLDLAIALLDLFH